LLEKEGFLVYAGMLTVPISTVLYCYDAIMGTLGLAEWAWPECAVWYSSVVQSEECRVITVSELRVF